VKMEASTAKNVTALEMKLAETKGSIVKSTATSEKNFEEFYSMIIRDLTQLHEASPPVLELNCAFVKDVVTVSSSDINNHFDLSILKLGYGNSPYLAQNVTCEASSDSSTGSYWFDTGFPPQNVLDEDWPNASDAAAGAYATMAARPSSQHQGSVGLRTALAVGRAFARWRMMQTRRAEGPFGRNLCHINLESEVPLLRNPEAGNALPRSLMGGSLLLADRATRGLLRRRNS
jgi:hypothetical protein